MFNWLLIFKQETVFFQKGKIYYLEPIWADEVFNTHLKEESGAFAVQRNPKIKLSPGTVFPPFAPQQKSLSNPRPGWG